MLRDGRKDRGELDRAELQEHQRDADCESQVADPVDDERLDRGGAGGRAVVPVADQQVGAETNAFPAEEQLQQIVRRHQHQHGEGEQRQIGEEPVARERIMRHVADRIDMDQHGDEGHHRDHHRGQRVVAQRPGHVEFAGFDPGAERHRARLGLTGDELEAGERAERAATSMQSTDDRHGGAIADRTAEQAGDQRTEQRREDGDSVDHRQPFIRFTSSTWIEPRLRK